MAYTFFFRNLLAGKIWVNYLNKSTGIILIIITIYIIKKEIVQFSSTIYLIMILNTLYQILFLKKIVQYIKR